MSDKTDKPRIRHLETDANGVLLPFETKKGRYNVIRPGEPLGVQRWTEYERLSIVMGTGQTFSALITALRGVEQLLGSDKPLAQVRTEAILTLNSLQRGLIDLSESRYNKALYQATIFVWRDGDDPLKWDMARATEYIEDWAEAGISEQDFFSFALATVTGFSEHYRALTERIRKEQAVLSGISTLRKPENMNLQ